ncbi:hypothetical protein HDU96_008339 [Phlyctochytrium bullatum]|nr:hypothetical protein HDU96_008339 [Phlyctochytrium bullatum]
MPKYCLPQFLLFGDSLTQQGYDAHRHGWVALLSDCYIRKAELRNRGFSGYNTRWLKPLLKEILSEFEDGQLLLMTVWAGANDAVVPEANAHQAVPLSEFKDNLSQMLQTAKSLHPRVKIVVITPPPVDAEAWGEHCKNNNRPADRTLERTSVYKDACLQVAEEIAGAFPGDIAMLDTFKMLDIDTSTSAERVKEKLRKVFYDGLHFNALGNDTVGDAVKALILATWPELNPENMNPLVPLHRELNEEEFLRRFA